MHRPRRSGVSLLELVAVVTIMGIFASVAMMRYGRSVFGEFGAHAECRNVQLALLAAQRAAVRTGDNHYVQFNAATATSYSIVRTTNSGPVVVDGPRGVGGDVILTVGANQRMEFTFEGQALAAYSATLIGKDRARTWTITVTPITGAVRVTETLP